MVMCLVLALACMHPAEKRSLVCEFAPCLQPCPASESMSHVHLWPPGEHAAQAGNEMLTPSGVVAGG